MGTLGHSQSREYVPVYRKPAPKSKDSRQDRLYDRELPPLTTPLRPLVDAVARMNANVHVKLLLCFLVGAVLLLGMAVVNMMVISRMSQRVGTLTVLQEKMDRARQMEYLVTVQSHYRGMAFLTDDDSYNEKIAKAKREFLGHLNAVEALSAPEQGEFFRGIRDVDAAFAVSSAKALELQKAGEIGEAVKVHIGEEHPISHELETAMRDLENSFNRQMQEARTAFRMDQKILSSAVWSFSGVSVALAMFLGFILSWAFVRPVRKIDKVVAAIADGDFSQRVEVPNRDEFGTLSRNVNKMSEQLATLYDKLQLELSQRQQVEEALAQRAVALEAANRELEAFSYSVSHDLRAPLRSIDGFSQALLEDYEEKLDTPAQDYLRRTRAASQRMGQLIDDLLGLSRVTRSEMHRESVDLSTLAESIAAGLQNTQPEREVEFVIARGLMAHGDARLVRVLLENLLSNAWKFTGKHPRARIEFGITQHEGKPAYFVRDDGAGFDPAYSDKLFKAFQRLHSTNEFEGTGIGLATVQRIVRRHGGHVWAEGAVEQGATFYFTLQ